MILSLEEIALPGGVARRLGVIAAELVTNAFQHALECGANNLSVSLRMVDAGALLTVADDGPGFDVEQAFGTGKGLPLCANLVQLGRGRLSLGALNAGTKIKVLLPLHGSHTRIGANT